MRLAKPSVGEAHSLPLVRLEDVAQPSLGEARGHGAAFRWWVWWGGRCSLPQVGLKDLVRPSVDEARGLGAAFRGWGWGPDAAFLWS